MREKEKRKEAEGEAERIQKEKEENGEKKAKKEKKQIETSLIERRVCPRRGLACAQLRAASKDWAKHRRSGRESTTLLDPFQQESAFRRSRRSHAVNTVPQ